MKKTLIKVAYVLWERFLIKSRVMIDDETITIRLGDVKGKIVSVRSEPSLTNIGKVLSLKLGNEMKIPLKNVKKIRLFKVRKSRKDLSGLFKEEVGKGSYINEVVLTYNNLELKLLMSLKDSLRLRKIILRNLKQKKSP
jgi:hypothetical protein